MAFPYGYAIDKYGLRLAMISNGVLVIFGCWIRCFVNTSFWFVIIGNGIAGTAKGVVYTGCPIFALKWFSPKNTPLVTSLLLLG